MVSETGPRLVRS